MARPRKVDPQRLLAAIDAGRERSYGTDENSDLGRKRADAIDAYLGLNTNPAPEGRSQVVDRSVYETVHTLMPSLVRIFAASSEDVIKLVPVGPDDEPAAEQSTAVLNHVVTQLNPWEQIVTDWLHDAMLSPTAYCMAYWDESERVITERYEDQSDDQLRTLQQDTGITIVEHETRPDEQGMADAQAAHAAAMAQWQQMAAAAQAQGGPPPPQPPAPGPMHLHTLTIERAENDGKVCLVVLPPEHCWVSQDTPSWRLDRCPFFEYREQKTLHELRAMGLDVPDDISDNESTDDSPEDYSRDRFGENRFDADDDGSQRRVWARMIWVEADAEGDGVSRLYYVIAVGRTILYDEPAGRIHVASMTLQPQPHRHPGMSIAETVIDLQNVRTVIKRGALDNLYLANAPRHAISDKVSLDDYLDARPGLPVRLHGGAMPGDGHVLPLTHPFAFDQIVGSLEYFDQERQNRTGASRYFSGTDAGAINKTASGTIALQNMASMRVEHLARTAAPAVEQLFDIVQELMSKHANRALALKLKGKWVNVDPQAWRTKRDVRISVGVGAGNKESMMGHLQGVLAAQMQVGLPLGLVTRENIHETNIEILKLAGFANPARFWPDPAQLPPPQPPMSPEAIKAQAEMQKLQFQAQQDAHKFQAEQQMEQQRMAMQAQLDQHREEMQARQKLLEQQVAAQADQAKLALDQWKAALDAAVKLEIANKTAETSLETADMARSPDTRVDSLVQTIAELQESMRMRDEEAALPAEFVRGQDGRIAEIRRGASSRKVVRGPDGRPIGLQ